VGPVTQRVQAQLYGLLRGHVPLGEWLTPVYPTRDRDPEPSVT
jgi:hypothetical protein